MLYQIAEKVYELENSGRKVTKMNVGELDFPTPEEIVDAAADALKQGKTSYGSAAGEKSLREKIAEMHKADPANIIITPGSKWAIFTTIDLICRGKEIVSFTPGWPAFGSMARHFDAALHNIPLGFDHGWEVDVDSFAEQAKGRSLAILNNPMNPTSKAWDDKVQEEMVQRANEQGVPVLLDIAYRDISFEKKHDVEWKEGMIICNSFSKSLAMTGWRLGYVVADKSLVERYKSLNQISITCVPKFIQAAALAGLENRDKITDGFRKECKLRADAAMEALKKEGVECVAPDAGFYVFPKLPCDDSFKACMALLDKHAIAMVPGSVFGDYPEHVRISLTYPPQVIQDSLEKLMEVVGS